MQHAFFCFPVTYMVDTPTYHQDSVCDCPFSPSLHFFLNPFLFPPPPLPASLPLSLPSSFPLGWGHPPNRHLFTGLFSTVCEGVSCVVHQADHQETAGEKPHQYQVSPEATVQPCLPPQCSKEAGRCPHFQQHLHCVQVRMRLPS